MLTYTHTHTREPFTDNSTVCIKQFHKASCYATDFHSKKHTHTRALIFFFAIRLHINLHNVSLPPSAKAHSFSLHVMWEKKSIVAILQPNGKPFCLLNANCIQNKIYSFPIDSTRKKVTSLVR